MLLALLMLLAQDECMDRRPGLSKCVEYRPGGVCLAVCYSPSGVKKDGGTDANTLTGHGTTREACAADLERQCAARQKR